jgi:chemotaxis protein histidine kinase CheA
MGATELCPWCNSVISRDKFLEVEAKIREEEKRKLAAREELLRESLQAQFAATYEKQRQASERKMKAESDKAVAKIQAEKDAASKKLKEAEARELEIRKQARKEAEKDAAKQIEKQGEALQKAMVERDEIATKLKESEAHEREVRKQAKEEAAKAAAKELEKQSAVVMKVTAERDAATQKLKEANARESEIRKEAKAQVEKASAKELQKQREILEKDRDAAVLKKEAEFNREREALQNKVKTMERTLQNKTANQLGDGAEMDLHEVLLESFADTDDRITRVPKGRNGADLIHEVRYKGQSCGRIVIDCKNRQSWQDAYVSKLRDDQLAAGADHSILSSTVFPSGEKEMCLRSDVIVVNPARVVYIVHMLRRFLISTHVLGLSSKERHCKTDQLYKLIISDAYTRRFGDVVKVADDILQLDVEEQKTHSIVWRNRGALTKRMGSLLREIDTDVSSIIEGDGASRDGVATSPKLPPLTTSVAQRRDAV